MGRWCWSSLRPPREEREQVVCPYKAWSPGKPSRRPHPTILKCSTKHCYEKGEAQRAQHSLGEGIGGSAEPPAPLWTLTYNQRRDLFSVAGLLAPCFPVWRQPLQQVLQNRLIASGTGGQDPPGFASSPAEAEPHQHGDPAWAPQSFRGGVPGSLPSANPSKEPIQIRPETGSDKEQVSEH